MRLIDAQFTATPFYGSRRMTAWLNGQGHVVSRKKVRRLMNRMGIEAVYPRKRLSLPDSRAKRYPYLLKEVVIDRPNQVWGADITYIRLKRGFAYLVGIMDWFSRYVVAWALSITMEVDFCVEALRGSRRSSTRIKVLNSPRGASPACWKRKGS